MNSVDSKRVKTKNSVYRVALSRQASDVPLREYEQHRDSLILFPSPCIGSCWSPDAVSRINYKLLEKADIEEYVRFYDLRHTFASMFLSCGIDVKAISSMLGHFSAGFTPDTYTHITNDTLRYDDLAFRKLEAKALFSKSSCSKT